MLRIDRHWSMEVPAEWEAALRAFSPICDHIPWLALRWFPMQRQHRDGTWRDAGRWVIYECVHESLIDPASDIVHLLSGPQPSRIRDPKAAKAKALYANDYQCAMYRQHRVWARNLWVIQGSTGGHPVEYAMHEQKLLQAAGLPTDPPPLGGLPYAPFDERVIRQLKARNRLFQLGSLDRLRRQGAADWQREFDDAERLFRQQHMAMLTEQMAASADFIDYYTSSTKTATECRNTIPAMTPAQQRRAEMAHEQYVETGVLPTEPRRRDHARTPFARSRGRLEPAVEPHAQHLLGSAPERDASGRPPVVVLDREARERPPSARHRRGADPDHGRSRRGR